MEIVCPCGVVVKNVRPSQVGRKKYCSKTCKNQNMKRPKGLKYKIVKKNSAWFKKKAIVSPYRNHIRRRIDGKMQYVHRYKMEKMLRRKLNEDEVVHHIDGDGTNNKLSNLRVMKVEDHDALHHGLGAKALNNNEPF